MQDENCFHTDDKQHVLCEPGDLSIEIDKQTGSISISCRKEKYKPVTKKEDEKYIQIVLEKII